MLQQRNTLLSVDLQTKLSQFIDWLQCILGLP